MLEPNRWHYLEFEQPADGAGRGAMSSDRSLYLEIEGQERIYTGGISGRNSFRLRIHITESMARRYQALPIELKHGVLKVAMVDPENQRLLRELEREVGGNVKIQAYRTTLDLFQQGLAMYRTEDFSQPVMLRSQRMTPLPPAAWVMNHGPYRTSPRVWRTATMLYVALACLLGILIVFALSSQLSMVHHWPPLLR